VRTTTFFYHQTQGVFSEFCNTNFSKLLNFNKYEKTMILFALLLVAVVVNAQTADETAIKAVCEAETKAWTAGDKAAHAACWKLESYSRTYVTLADGTDIVVTLEQMKNPSAEVMGGGATFENSNYIFG
jgi:hypothetical protein